MRNILIIKCGETYPEIKEVRGCFDNWVIGQSNLPEKVFRVFDLEKGYKLRHPSEYIAAIITGSHYNTNEKHAWIKHLEDWIITAQYSNIPLLGICFGHQIIAQALGGTVEKNPQGLNLGTGKIDLTEAGLKDPIFKHYAKSFENYYAHSYHVSDLPLNSESLATNKNGMSEAFKINKTYGVQFHPEFSCEIVKMYQDSLISRGLLEKGQKSKIKQINQNIVSNFLDIALKF